MSELAIIEKGAVAFAADGIISSVGSPKQLCNEYPDADVVEVKGVLFPGFVDCHTHAVFGAARTADHERRARGISYMEIAAAGGGILSSVNDVRERTVDDLIELLRKRLLWLLSNGTTTVEVKSGYGLQTEAELRQLEAVRAVACDSAPALIPTFLGAHEVPPEYRADPDRYLDIVIDDMIPAVAQRGLARFCDVFCEPGVFTPSQSRRVLEAARVHGLVPKIHADELEGSGGAELAVELGASSADHLAAISDEGIKALAQSETTAVLLPGTMMYLGGRGQAPARKLIDAGAGVALATDFNPGSSPGTSLPFMATLGVSQMGMLPAETIIAITANGAAAVGEATSRGQIAKGYRADLTLMAVEDWRELPYWYGSNFVSEVWVGGMPCHPRRRSVDSLG
jgi:imidazolonepropionase